jgi:uncharacterized repeat protein (TIGR04076 family)
MMEKGILLLGLGRHLWYNSSIATGVDKPWLKKRNTDIVGCSDWYRPVNFRIEQTD